MTVGFLAGLALGWAHWRLFLASLSGLLTPAGPGRLRARATMGAGLRTGLTAGMGVLLVRSGGVNPLGLAAGLLASVVGFRIWAARGVRKGDKRG